MNSIEVRKWNRIYREIKAVSRCWRYADRISFDELNDVVNKVVTKLYQKEKDGTVILDEYENYKHYAFIIANNYVLTALFQKTQIKKNQILKNYVEFDSRIHSNPIEPEYDFINSLANFDGLELKILELKFQGYETKEIAKEVGFSKSWITRTLREIKSEWN